ncbi:bifunctional alpha/beta hydrolase/OsmC family protein [Arhodomonas sp. AD133]|uniref:bifunctional alpha/beta hydrolase/OsmC family protein n=1 Tax=Arhodomonas sp. AD133 TaxID=3415009 RepID=UPI003EB8B87E
MASQRLDFTGTDGQRLAARLDLPAGTPRAWALFAHCFTCGKDIRAAGRIAAALAAQGIATLRFDFTGLGGSEGEFANAGFSSNIDDLVAAADFMRETGRPVSLLIGHSLGGAAVLAAASRIPETAAVAVIGAPFEAEHVLAHLGDHLETIETEGEATVSLAGRSFRISRSFVEDARGQDQSARLRELAHPLLVMHSPRDAIVGVDNARQIFEHARHPKSFVSLDDTDHLLSRPADAEYAATVLAAWAARYLPETRPRANAGADAQVLVEETGAGRFQQRVRAGGHELLADEPESAGGTDTGPSPYDYLLAGLGACTAMTLRLYAERKGLALERVQVLLDHTKIHASDCEECETREGRLDEIARRVVLHGELSDEQRGKLLEIADKCPVHRTLHAEVRVRTELVS